MQHKNQLDKNLHLRLPMSFKTRLQEVATQYDQNTSSFVRSLLMYHIKEYEKRPR